jgi:hypothetical protein
MLVILNNKLYTVTGHKYLSRILFYYIIWTNRLFKIKFGTEYIDLQRIEYYYLCRIVREQVKLR